MARPEVPSKQQLTVPVGTRHSFGIELEFLVAHLPTKALDPDEDLAGSLPPLLRVDEAFEWRATVAVLEHIRKTLGEHGILVAEPTTDFSKEAAGADDHEPERLRNRDRWEIGTDASVQPVDSPQDNGKKYRWTGIEVRSPAFWAMDRSFTEVKLIVNLLKSLYRLRVNAHCGFHVHVANGRQFFTAKTIKRLGAFLWAADPLLSRLHAPWRRVGGYSTSIRYASKLARRELTAADAKMMVRQAARFVRSETRKNLDTVPEVPWSDTTREEMDYGGRQGWEEHARLWRETAPTMTIPGEVDNTVSNNPNLDPGFRLSSSPSSSSSSNSDSSSSSGLVSNQNPIWAWEGEDIDHVPDAGGEHDRRLHSLMETDAFLALCEEQTGHAEPNKLSTNEQHMLVAMVHCQDLFGHAELSSLSPEEEAAIFDACAPYVQASRSVWGWDPETEQWYLDKGQIGSPPLTHVRPRKETRTNAPRVIRRFEQIAAMLELDPDGIEEGERGQEGIDFVSRSELDKARRTNKGYERLIMRLREFITTPDTDRDSIENLDDSELDELIEQYEEDIQTGEEQIDEQKDGGSQNEDDGDDDIPEFPPGMFYDMKNKKNQAANKKSQPGKSDVSSPFVSLVSTVPPPHGKNNNDNNALPGGPDNSNQSGSSPIDKSSHNPPPAGKAPKRPSQKLRPHNVAHLSKRYISTISTQVGLAPGDWSRISWLPSASRHHQRPDPAEPHPAPSGCRRRRECAAHARTTARAGLAAITACESAAEVGMLLDPSNEGDDDDDDDDDDYFAAGERLNYNFRAYAPEGLGELDGKTCSRTLEFREAGGTMDADWVVLWARICVGIARWCRDAPVREFLGVLGELDMWEEEREAEAEAEVEAGAEGEVRFDVCDLLDCLGMSAEAEGVRARERRKGPPR